MPGDELKPADIVWTVSPHAAHGALRLWQQTSPLVVADCFHMNAGGCSQPADRHCASSHPLDSVLRYGDYHAGMALRPAQSSLPALIGAAAAAIGASVCCVVPLVLVLMGISGAWISNLTALEAWRPWFSAATLVCLGWAFWRLYGPTRRCHIDGLCVDPTRLQRQRCWLWFATGLIVLLLLFPYYIGWFL